MLLTEPVACVPPTPADYLPLLFYMPGHGFTQRTDFCRLWHLASH